MKLYEFIASKTTLEKYLEAKAELDECLKMETLEDKGYKALLEELNSQYTGLIPKDKLARI